MRLECGCPGDYPDWDNKDIDLEGHPAHVLPIASLMYMPLAYDVYRQRAQTEIEQLELTETCPGLTLTRTGLLRGQIITLLQHGRSPSRHVRLLAPPFRVHGQLHHGDIGTLRNSVRQLQMRLFDMGRMPKEMYLCYLTCPRCAQARGGDKILVLRRWQDSRKLAAKVSRK